MRSSVRALVILTAILLVIVAATVILAVGNHRRTQETDNERAASVLHLGGLSEPVYISYNCGGADSVTEFILEAGVWYCAAERDLPLKQDYLCGVAELVPGLKAVRKLDIAEELTYYGLDRPAYVFTAKDGSGKTLSLYIGNKLAGGQYYALNPEDEVLYTIEKDLPELLGSGLYDLSVTEAYDTLLESNLREIEITGADGTAVRFEKAPNGGASDKNENVWHFKATEGLVPAGEFTAGSGAAAQNYIDAIIAGIERSFFYSCEDFNCTDAQLSDYGLLEPMRVSVGYTTEDAEEKTVVFLFGKQFTETSEIYGEELFNYAMLEGGKAVNSMTARRVTPFTDALAALG